MTLRARPVEQAATLPDGRYALVRVGIPEDPYIAKRELDTVAIELLLDGEVALAVNTILRADQESEALDLAREIAAGLETGELEPAAGDIEPLANRVPESG